MYNIDEMLLDLKKRLLGVGDSFMSPAHARPQTLQTWSGNLKDFDHVNDRILLPCTGTWFASAGWIESADERTC